MRFDTRRGCFRDHGGFPTSGWCALSIRNPAASAVQIEPLGPSRTFSYAVLSPKHPQACLDKLKRCVRDGPMVGRAGRLHQIGRAHV